jgi:uncharacterized protein
MTPARAPREFVAARALLGPTPSEPEEPVTTGETDETKGLREPWLVAAWPGMGAVGLHAVAHLARRLGAQPLRELHDEQAFDITKVEVQGGLFQRPRRPRTWLMGWKAPPGRGRDLLLLLGEAQPDGRGWDFARNLVREARELGATRVVTFASMATPMDAREPPVVFGAATDAALLAEARRCDVQPLDGGEVSGLNGVLVAAAADAGLPGLCLLGQFPFFAHGLPNPRASAAVLRAFARLSGVDVDVADLEAQGRELEPSFIELQEQTHELVERVRPSRTEPEEPATSTEPRPDAATRARLEALFEAARADRGKALELKAELDRLGLFREHEDRFLDLFRRGE